MAAFTINHQVLQQILHVNQFVAPDVSIVLIGIRGAIVNNPNDQEFRNAITLNVMDINYINPRCTVLQWRLNEGLIAAFPASTVPHQSNIKSALIKGGAGANSLMTGFYNDYRKGMHKNDSPTGHEAFRQNAPRPVRRTADDLDFEKDDRIEYENPQDNLHCGWFDGLSSSSFASAGCQVVMGFPKCQKREKNIGPWKIFHDNAYSIMQNSFPYVLINGTEVFSLANEGNTAKAKLKYGSSGEKVTALQQRLKDLKFYEGTIDGSFLERTLKAVIAFQKHAFGNDGADGVVGPVTAEELNLDLSI